MRRYKYVTYHISDTPTPAPAATLPTCSHAQHPPVCSESALRQSQPSVPTGTHHIRAHRHFFITSLCRLPASTWATAQTWHAYVVPCCAEVQHQYHDVEQMRFDILPLAFSQPLEKRSEVPPRLPPRGCLREHGWTPIPDPNRAHQQNLCFALTRVSGYSGHQLRWWKRPTSLA